MDKIINNLPSSYKKDLWVQMLMRTAQLQLDDINTSAVQLGNELLLNMMSEKQLAVEEKLCGITPTSQDIGERKAVVSAKWKSKNVVTLKSLQAIADGFNFGGRIELSYDSGAINVTFVAPDNAVDDVSVQEIYNALRNTAPAHLPINTNILYPEDATQYVAAIVQIFDDYYF